MKLCFARDLQALLRRFNINKASPDAQRLRPLHLTEPTKVVRLGVRTAPLQIRWPQLLQLGLRQSLLRSDRAHLRQPQDVGQRRG